MTISQFERVLSFLVKDVIHNKKERKIVMELVDYLHELFDNKLQKEEQMPVEFHINLLWYFKARRWKKYGYCEQISNTFNLRITQNAIIVFDKLVKKFEQIVSSLEEYNLSLEKYAIALKEQINLLEELRKDIPRLVKEAVEKGMKEEKNICNGVKETD
jgi:exonuclease VII small subunit